MVGVVGFATGVGVGLGFAGVGFGFAGVGEGFARGVGEGFAEAWVCVAGADGAITTVF